MSALSDTRSAFPTRSPAACAGAVRGSVSVELAETTGGAVVWASHFDGISEDLFALQDEIARRVVGAIAPRSGKPS